MLPTVRAFRVVAVAEAVSWLVLIVATAVKYLADTPIGVKIMGPIHGALFIGYCLLALHVRSQLRWNLRTFAIVLVDAVLPGGGFAVIRRRDLQPAAA